MTSRCLAVALQPVFAQARKTWSASPHSSLGIWASQYSGFDSALHNWSVALASGWSRETLLSKQICFGGWLPPLFFAGSHDATRYSLACSPCTCDLCAHVYTPSAAGHANLGPRNERFERDFDYEAAVTKPFFQFESDPALVRLGGWREREGLSWKASGSCLGSTMHLLYTLGGVFRPCQKPCRG